MTVRVSPRTLVRWLLASAGATVVLFSLVSWLSPAFPQAHAEIRWTTRGFAEFAKGQFDSGGANLYVSRRGTLQTINLFDLNHDGYLDLLFNQSHDYNTRVNSVIYWNGERGFLPDRRGTVLADGGYKALASDLDGDGRTDLVVVNRFNGTSHHVDSYVYWGTADGLSPSSRTSLPTLGAMGVAAADLNKDGFTDLVFANGGSLEAFTIGKVDDRESYVYWGGRNGYSPANRTSLAAVNPVGVAIADLNADGLPDVVLANSGPESPGIYIYWNSPGGIKEQNRQTLRAGDPSSVFISDLNRDGFPEIVVTRKTGGSLVLWNRAGTFSPARSASFPGEGATGGCAGDLNHDGLPDLVLLSDDRSRIYWGNADGPRPQRLTYIETSNLTACSVADLNRDGRADLVLSRYRDGQSYDIPSLILWGGTDGVSLNRKALLPTSGATDAQIGDFNGDSLPDLVFVNNIAGRTKGDISSYIYWGNATHDYSPKSRLELPAHSNYKACSADLNDDGYTDLIFANSWDDEPTGAGTAWIYWGSAAGFRPDHRQELLVGGAFGCSVADLNRDGYLDIVFSNVFTKEETAHHPRRDFGDKGGIIYWGGPSGYNGQNRTLLPAAAPMGNRIADFNKDGYLDILFTTWQGGDAAIFWGSKSGFSERNRTAVPAISSVNAEIADLNHDGYLDLILCNHIDGKTLRHTVPSYIYYGGPGGFSAANRIELPTLGAHDASVADLNGDGNLDIVFSNYHADASREPPSYIYWGDSSGRFQAANRTELPTRSAAGNMIADLNGDGYPDIIFSNHVLDGDHHVNSYIYWGGPTGFDPERKTELPTIGPHNMFSVDIGNLYSRKLEEEYRSVPYPLEGGFHTGRLEWNAETPFNTSVRFQIRVAQSERALEQSKWLGPDGEGSSWTRSGASLPVDARASRWLQYRVLLTTPDGGNTARLHEVSVIFSK